MTETSQPQKSPAAVTALRFEHHREAQPQFGFVLPSLMGQGDAPLRQLLAGSPQGEKLVAAVETVCAGLEG